MSSQIQLTYPKKFNDNNMIFGTPVGGAVKDTSIKFRRIPISYKYDNGNTGDLIVPTSRLFSFGVCENIDPTTKKANGYVFPIVLASKDGQTQEETDFINTLNKIVEKAKKHVLTNKKDLKIPTIDESDLKKFNPIFYKKDKETGDIATDALPTLYLKLAVSKKDGTEKILSNFYDKSTGDELNPLDIVKQYCFTTVAIKIESIFLGSKISFQVKLYEADVELIGSGNKKRLLPRPEADTTVSISKSTKLDDDDVVNMEDDNDDDVEVSSIKSEEQEPEPEPEPPKVKRVVKTVSAKKK